MEEFFLDCIQCGHCCGYRRDSHFGGCSYSENEKIPPGIKTIKKGNEFFIPVDENDVCVYLVKLNNGFAKCGIQDKKPNVCKLYNCLTEKKIRYLQVIVGLLKKKCG